MSVKVRVRVGVMARWAREEDGGSTLVARPLAAAAFAAALALANAFPRVEAFGATNLCGSLDGRLVR